MIQKKFSEDIDIVEVSKKNKGSIELFAEFYKSIFMQNFPKEDERASLAEDLIYYETLSADADAPWMTAILIDKFERIVGGVVYSIYKNIFSVSVQFIVVSKECRGKNIAGKLLDFVLAKALEKSEIEWLFIEIENPTYAENLDMSFWHFWKKQGIKIIDFDYVQPAIKNKMPVNTLLLCAKNLIDNDVKFISATLTAKFIVEYAEKAIMIENSKNDESIKKMLTALAGKLEKIKLIDMKHFD